MTFLEAVKQVHAASLKSASCIDKYAAGGLMGIYS